jgi:hypothetical protein
MIKIRPSKTLVEKFARLGKSEMSFYEVLSEALRIKGIKYSFSNPEKTALELIYFKHYSENESLEILSELSPDRLIKY